jgi:hypothetical protein
LNKSKAKDGRLGDTTLELFKFITQNHEDIQKFNFDIQAFMDRKILESTLTMDITL